MFIFVLEKYFKVFSLSAGSKTDTYMKPMLIMTLTFLFTLSIYSQKQSGNQLGMTLEQNLRALVDPSLYSTTTGFDGRYLGIKGSPRLFDTLVPSSLLIRGKDEYLNLPSDIDVVRNSMVFKAASTGELLEVSSDYIAELVFHNGGKDLVFRTTGNLAFDKEFEGCKFYIVLKEDPWQFIMIPDKELVEADYKRVYSPDIRYDEYKPANKYYIKGDDSRFHRVQLTRKSLIKLFPDKRSVIESNFNEKSEIDPEAAVISLLNKF
jgi:hypothetical protein